MKKIAIIGGGASGTLLAVNLIKHAGSQPLEINLIEKKERFGRGVAYSAQKDFHLLNVPAAKMGAFPDDAEHFHRWLAAKDFDFAPNDFVPRRVYGEYLRDLYDETAARKPANVHINVFDAEAVDVSLSGARAEVALDSGENLTADKIILAFGNFLPPHPKSKDRSFIEAEKYFQNPWNDRIFDKIESTDRIFIIGTGLTFADVAMSLCRAGHAGDIFALSTRGLLPAVHKLGFSYESFGDELDGQTRITDLLKIVRRHIEKAESAGGDWRGVIDSLRPHTQKIWFDLPHSEKRYFMQHLSRYWNVARHRLPPETARTLDEMQSAKQLQIKKGRLQNIEPTADGKFEIVYSANGSENKLTASAIINCTGSESNYSRLDASLVKNLLARGYIRNDSMNLGIDALPDGRTLDEAGSASNNIHALGTALKGVLWESTAMPEIRAQAQRLALNLLNDNKTQ